MQHMLTQSAELDRRIENAGAVQLKVSWFRHYFRSSIDMRILTFYIQTFNHRRTGKFADTYYVYSCSGPEPFKYFICTHPTLGQTFATTITITYAPEHNIM